MLSSGRQRLPVVSVTALRVAHMAEGELQWFTTTQVDDVPVAPGLYAWYAVPVACPPDWQAEFDAQGQDRGGQNFGSFLAQHTRRLRTPTMRIEAKGHLWSSWTGSLAEAGTLSLAALLERLAGEEEPRLAKNLFWALRNSTARELLATLLIDASPRLSAPVYIGVAKNLRERLSQHLEALVKAHVLLDGGTKLTDELSGKFGGRAAEAGLGVDDLRIATLLVPEFAGLEDNELRRVAEAAEFILNRWHHPLFGER